MSVLEEKLFKKCPHLGEYLVAIRDIVKKSVWDGPIVLNEYPDHGFNHSEKIISFLDEIVPQANPNLSADELYILLSTAYLHDIGLQFPNYIPELKKVLATKGIPGLTAKKQQILRDKHREIVAQIIEEEEQFKNLHPPYHSIIGEICTKHRASHLGEDYMEMLGAFGGEKIRFRLLIALLQCGDALHLSADRVNMKKVDLISHHSKKYWWKNHYIREIVIDEKTNRIRVHYEIPREFEENMRTFMHFAELRFRGYPGDALDVMWDHGIRLRCGGPEAWIMINDEKSKMPQEIMDDIENYSLEIEKKSREERIKLIRLEEF